MNNQANNQANVTNHPPLESVPMLASLGESDQAATYTASRKCVTANGAGGRLSDNSKVGQTTEGLRHGSMTYPAVLPFEPESTVEPGTLSTLGSNGGEN